MLGEFAVADELVDRKRQLHYQLQLELSKQAHISDGIVPKYATYTLY
jgi:hypothetical protein